MPFNENAFKNEQIDIFYCSILTSNQEYQIGKFKKYIDFAFRWKF